MILERERAGERERETLSERETLISHLPYAPGQGLEPQPFGAWDDGPTEPPAKA